MSRRKGSRNKGLSFVSNERIKRKAKKLLASVDDFLILSERNRLAFNELDWQQWEEIKKTLSFISREGEHFTSKS